MTDALAELSRCSGWVDEPGGDPVVGAGGAQCRFLHRTVVGTVCLVYNGITIGSSCSPIVSHDGGGSASTKPTKCLPGLWQTQVIIAHAHGPDTEVLSDPVLLTCILGDIIDNIGH